MDTYLGYKNEKIILIKCQHYTNVGTFLMFLEKIKNLRNVQKNFKKNFIRK